jgi:hypothetical protein
MNMILIDLLIGGFRSIDCWGSLSLEISMVRTFVEQFLWRTMILPIMFQIKLGFNQTSGYLLTIKNLAESLWTDVTTFC